MTRRIMREFSISEISAVDAPAQEGARARIMKRAIDDDDFDTIVSHIQKRDDCSRLEAMRKAARQHPDALAAYQGDVPFATKQMAKARSREQQEFDTEVAGLLAREKGLSRTAAMGRVRRSRPDLFAAAFE